MTQPRFTIRRIDSKDVWEAYAARCAPHTFLQSWNWGEFNANTGTDILRVGIFKGDVIEGVCLVLIVKARRGTHLLCPHGPLLRNWSDSEPFKALLAYLRKEAVAYNAAFIRMCPALMQTPEAEALFRTHGFRPSPIHTHPELAWMIDVTGTEEEVLGRMRKQTRYAIRKAEKDGVSVETSEDISGVETFYDVYGITAKQQQFTPFSRMFLEKEFSTFAQDHQAVFFFARYEGKVIACALIVFAYESGFYHHGASVSVPGINAPHLLQWRIIQEARKRGMRLYNFWGIAPDDAPKTHPWAGFSFFKKSFGGFSEAYVPSQDLVLSYRYWLNYIVEKVRKVRRGF